MKIPLNQILPNPAQPRKVFNPLELATLADSLKERGIIQAILVEEAGDQYILVDGERRLRAAKLAGWKEIEAIVRPSQNGSGAEYRLVDALVANLQRRDLDPVEEGRAFKRLIAEYKWPKLRISQVMGRSLALVDSRLRLLDLDEPIQDLVARGQLFSDRRVTEALLSIPERTARVKTAKQIVARGVKLQTAVKICARVKGMLSTQGAPVEDIPALARAREKTRTRKLPPAKWDMLRQTGKLPPWEIVIGAAQETCAGCALRSIASAEVCRSCPAAELLGRLIKIAEDDHGN